MMEDFFIGTYRKNLHRLLDKLHLVNDRHFMYAIPGDTPLDLERNIAAAVKAYFLRLKSIDYTLKRYGECWEIGPEYISDRDKTLDELLAQVNIEIVRVTKWVTDFHEKPDVFGLVVAGSALIRLQSSFRTAGLLIRLGYIFEASAICRLILEQVAWAYEIHKIEDDRVYKVSPSKAVTTLKELLPSVGRTYGFLNRFTHIDPELIHKYIELQDEDVSVGLNLTENILEWAWALLYLADYYSVVTEYIYRDVIPGLTVIEQDSRGDYISKEDRPLQELVESYRDKLGEKYEGNTQ